MLPVEEYHFFKGPCLRHIVFRRSNFIIFAVAVALRFLPIVREMESVQC